MVHLSNVHALCVGSIMDGQNLSALLQPIKTRQPPMQVWPSFCTWGGGLVHIGDVDPAMLMLSLSILAGK